LRLRRLLPLWCAERHEKAGQVPARPRIGQDFIAQRRIVAMARPDEIEPQFVRQPFADFRARRRAALPRHPQD
jgi:hypothetical protein